MEVKNIEEEEKVEEEVKPTKVTLTKEQEVEMFKSLAHKTYKDVGYQYGIHLMFPGQDNRVSSFVYDLARKIKRAPELWGLTQDLVDVVQEAQDKRSIHKNPKLVSDRKLEEESFRDKLDTMRDTVAEIISKKLQKYNTKKGIEEISIRDLKDLLIATIDKSRLLRGESTENIKKLSPLNVDDYSPEDALKIVMKARDMLVEGKK